MGVLRKTRRYGHDARGGRRRWVSKKIEKKREKKKKDSLGVACG